MNNNWEKLNYAVHPGEILNEYLKDANMTQIELANKTGINKIMINEIVKGKRPITMRTAIKLERAFSFAAKFWVNLQMIYYEAVERLKIKSKECSSSIYDFVCAKTDDDFHIILMEKDADIRVEWDLCAA